MNNEYVLPCLSTFTTKFRQVMLLSGLHSMSEISLLQLLHHKILVTVDHDKTALGCPTTKHIFLSELQSYTS